MRRKKGSRKDNGGGRGARRGAAPYRLPRAPSARLMAGSVGLVDRSTWTPPESPGSTGDLSRVRGALGGSRLLAQPEHQKTADAILTFLEVPGQVVLEIGFDRGGRLLALAAANPEVRWLGVEIRKERAREAANRAPSNALLLHLDGRTLLASAVPAGRLHRIDVLFPTPSLKGHHLLWTPDFVQLAARALGPSGVLWLQTDVPALADLADALLVGWRPAPPPPRDPVPSRRARVCERDQILVFERSVSPP